MVVRRHGSRRRDGQQSRAGPEEPRAPSQQHGQISKEPGMDQAHHRPAICFCRGEDGWGQGGDGGAVPLTRGRAQSAKNSLGLIDDVWRQAVF